VVEQEVLVVDIIIITVFKLAILKALDMVVLVDLVVEHTHTIIFLVLNRTFTPVVLVSVDRDILEVVTHSINHLDLVL
jgi:hypothetical protein